MGIISFQNHSVSLMGSGLQTFDQSHHTSIHAANIFVATKKFTTFSFFSLFCNPLPSPSVFLRFHLEQCFLCSRWRSSCTCTKVTLSGWMNHFRTCPVSECKSKRWENTAYTHRYLETDRQIFLSFCVVFPLDLFCSLFSPLELTAEPWEVVETCTISMPLQHISRILISVNTVLFYFPFQKKREGFFVSNKSQTPKKVLPSFSLVI